MSSAPASTSAASAADKGYDLVYDFELDDTGIRARKYRSRHSGLSVCLAQVDGPTVNGFFVLATEAESSDGCPHTLEHLIFLGSELYPYKGVLDCLANKCLAQGTNAWTDVDHTAYTISCAGHEGFLNIMPVFVDHILYPTLRDTGFVTEVHHVDGEGKDAGVVYCEMQGRQNTARSRAHRALAQALYPAPCGFRHETGGTLEELRTLTVDTVRAYHRAFYRPDNLCLVITGSVEPEQVFDALRTVEQRIASKPALDPMPQRPFARLVPAMEESQHLVVPFPSDEETHGHVYVAWRAGPISDHAHATALTVLWTYLTDSSVSPLQHAFVDIEQPLASSVSSSAWANKEMIRYVKLSTVPVEQLELVEEKVFDVLRTVYAGPLGIDMGRMQSIIERLILHRTQALEEDPHETMAFDFIQDFLYFGDDMHEITCERQRLEQLLAQDAAWWQDVLARLVRQPRVVLRMQPSHDFDAKLESDEAERTKAQAEALGPDRLASLQQELEAAVEVNDTHIPPSVLEAFQVPDASRIPLFPVVTVRNGRLVSSTAADSPVARRVMACVGNRAPASAPSVFVQFDHIRSSFVEVNVYLDTSNLCPRLRPFLELWLDVIFEASVLRHGKQALSHEEVVEALTRDTISYSNNVGLSSGGNFVCGEWAQLVTLAVQVEVEKYELGISWLHDLLWRPIWSAHRLSVGAKKLLQDITAKERGGSRMASTVASALQFDAEQSNHGACNILRQKCFLTQLVQQLDSEPEATTRMFDVFCKALVAPNTGMWVHVIGNVLKIPNAKSAWSTFGDTTKPRNLDPTLPVPSNALFSKDAQSGRAVVLPMAIESSFIVQTFAGPDRHDHADIAPLAVLIEYLDTMEGPFWKQIRGLGLAYGYGTWMYPEKGTLTFRLDRCVDPVKAYRESIDIIKQHLAAGVDAFPAHLVEAAKSGVIFGLISREDTQLAAGEERFHSFLRGFTTREAMAATHRVQPADLARVLRKWMGRMFDADRVNLCISTAHNKAEEVAHDFAVQFNHKCTIVESSSYDAFVCGLTKEAEEEKWYAKWQNGGLNGTVEGGTHVTVDGEPYVLPPRSSTTIRVRHTRPNGSPLVFTIPAKGAPKVVPPQSATRDKGKRDAE